MSTTGSAGRKRTGRFVPKGAAGALLIGAAGGLLLLAAGMTLSCVNSDPTAPEGSTITVSADPQTVQPGVNSKITATVRSMNGTRLPDQEVIFTTTAGKLSTGSNAVTTDTAGQAESTLSTTQNATVTAASGTVTASTTVTFSTCTLQNFTVVPTPQSIPTCLSTVDVQITALDTNGQPCASVVVLIVTEPVTSGYNEMQGTFTPLQGVTDATGTFSSTFSPNQTQCQSDCSVASNPSAPNGGLCELAFAANNSGSITSSTVRVRESIQ